MTMAEELREAPLAVERQAGPLTGPLNDLLARLRRHPPAVVVTCARGSSAHAATFAKHLIEYRLGLPVAAAAPGMASVYGRSLRLRGQLFFSISQSGQSDDLIASARLAHKAGAHTACLVNDAASPLAAACDIVLPIAAGPERSIAATKSFIASLAALLRLVALWSGDSAARDALDRLPSRLAAAIDLDWSAAIEVLARARSLLVVGRGPTLGVAREAALKFKEVTNLHAEAFSGAELRHGPVAMINRGFPVMLLMPSDQAAEGLQQLGKDLSGSGASVLYAGYGGALPTNPPDHPATDPIALIQSFYAMLPALAARRGIDPERPRHLRKITRTR
jgi:glucosamine--fructose-6-phosphate aminotransferase (isomerizing)